MRFTKASLFLFASVPLAFADVSFTLPAAGATYGTSFSVTWAESNTAPLITALSAYDLVLYTGSHASPSPLKTLVAAGTFTSNTVAVTIDPGIGGNFGAAFPYFLGMKSTATAGGYVINYSARFNITGMTGSFPAAITTALAAVSGTAGPATSNNVAAAAPAAADSAADTGNYAIPYNQQTGPIRYAPMQPIPATKITAVNTAPLWPTSSVVVATTLLPIPSIQTTITQAGAPQTFASHANTASAAPQPSDDMQKFLNRWKD